MELWIRSQSRQNLMKANDIVVQDNNILVFKDDDASTTVGTYKTKERALEVLDEINEILQLKLCSTLGTFEEVFNGYTEEQIRLVLKQMAVYEIPKE